jgi:hypothetical protein
MYPGQQKNLIFMYPGQHICSQNYVVELVPDQHIWKLTQTGSYSSKSAYAAIFVGANKFGP